MRGGEEEVLVSDDVNDVIWKWCDHDEMNVHINSRNGTNLMVVVVLIECTTAEKRCIEDDTSSSSPSSLRPHR